MYNNSIIQLLSFNFKPKYNTVTNTKKQTKKIIIKEEENKKQS